MDAAATSARITMPAPPPAGVSSTERCLSKAKSRMSMVESAHLPSASALPARLRPRGPGNISGKMVSTVARQVIPYIVMAGLGPAIHVCAQRGANWRYAQEHQSRGLTSQAEVIGRSTALDALGVLLFDSGVFEVALMHAVEECV